MPEVTDATQGDTLERIVASGDLVIADFFTPNCVICKRVHPMLAAAKASFDGRVHAFKIDAQARPDLARRFDIRGVPYLVLFKAGKVIERHSGFMTASALRNWITTHLEDSDDTR